MHHRLKGEAKNLTKEQEKYKEVVAFDWVERGAFMAILKERNPERRRVIREDLALANDLSCKVVGN